MLSSMRILKFDPIRLAPLLSVLRSSRTSAVTAAILVGLLVTSVTGCAREKPSSDRPQLTALKAEPMTAVQIDGLSFEPTRYIKGKDPEDSYLGKGSSDKAIRKFVLDGLDGGAALRRLLRAAKKNAWIAYTDPSSDNFLVEKTIRVDNRQVLGQIVVIINGDYGGTMWITMT